MKQKGIVNIAEEFKKVTAYATPLILAEANNQYVKIAKILGNDVPWHNHQEEDELFYIIDRRMQVYARRSKKYKTYRRRKIFHHPKLRKTKILVHLSFHLA